MNKKLIISIIAAIAILILISAIYFYLFSLIDNSQILSKKPYVNTEFGWKIYYPEGWEIYDEDNNYVTFLNNNTDDFYIPRIKVEEPGFFENITLDEKIIEMNNLFENDSGEDFVLLSQRNRTIDNMDSYEFVYNYKMTFDWVKFKQIFIEKNREIFEIHYVAFEDTYDTFENIAEECIKSFEFI